MKKFHKLNGNFNIIKVIILLLSVQTYVKQLNYNHSGTQFFETKPNSSMITLMETAKSIVREALPIKCVEGK